MESRKLREALRKQGIHVHESDPILDMATICDVVMADTLKAMEGVVKAAADRTSTAAAQAVDASKSASEVIISQGATFLVEQFREAVHDATVTMLAELRQEVVKAERASRTASRAVWVAGCFSAAGLSALAGFVVAGLGHR
jgi:hypothetical protein